MLNRIFSILIVCFFLLSISLPATAQTGRESIESLIKVFATLHGHHWELDPRELAQAAKYIDYHTMAQRALGENDWQRLSNTQKKIYLQSFKSLIERRYYTRWHRIFAKSKIVYGSETKNGDAFLVNSSIITGSSTKPVVWTLYGDPPKIINLTVGDRDLLKVAHARFQRKIAGVGMPAFVSWLQKRSRQNSDQNDTDLSAEKK